MFLDKILKFKIFHFSLYFLIFLYIICYKSKNIFELFFMNMEDLFCENKNKIKTAVQKSVWIVCGGQSMVWYSKFSLNSARNVGGDRFKEF